MIPVTIIELFDRYHRGELSRDEIVSLEFALRNDAQQTLYYQEYLALKEGIHHFNQRQLRDELQVASRLELGRGTRIVRMRRNLAIAATVLVLISAGLWAYRQQNPQQQEMPVAEQQNPSPTPEETTPPQKQEPQPQIAENTPAPETSAAAEQYQQGMALLQNGKMEEARVLLAQIPESAKAYFSKAQYQIAYSHFKDGNLTKAIELLEEIVQQTPDPDVKKSAEELLNTLKLLFNKR